MGGNYGRNSSEIRNEALRGNNERNPSCLASSLIFILFRCGLLECMLSQNILFLEEHWIEQRKRPCQGTQNYLEYGWFDNVYFLQTILSLFK